MPALAFPLNSELLKGFTIPQDGIAKRLGIPRKTLFNYLAKMPAMAKWPNRGVNSQQKKLAT